MRRRILCLVLFGHLLAPAIGRATGAEQNPDGQPSAVSGEALLLEVGSESEAVEPPAADSSFLKVLLDWLEFLDLSL